MSERIILLIAGESGSGKSFFVANLKKSLIVDTDLGGGLKAYDERIKRNGSVRFDCGSYLDLMDRLKEHNLGDINTLAIDHLTTLHQEAVNRHNPRMTKDFGLGSDKAAREWRKVRELVRFGDYNLVCVSHLKGKWEDEKVVGDQADAAKKIEGDFDVVIHTYNDGHLDRFPKTCRVHKWRRDPEDPRGRVPASFPFTVEDFTRLSGGFAGERTPIPLATAEQVKELNLLLSLLRIPEADVAKWKAKAKVERFEDFSGAGIAKAIADLEARLKARKPYGATNGQREPGVEDEVEA